MTYQHRARFAALEGHAPATQLPAVIEIETEVDQLHAIAIQNKLGHELIAALAKARIAAEKERADVQESIAATSQV